MSPEQLEGKEADARSDLFSFGVVLYEMATGKRPFEGRSQASLIAAILKEEPRPISTLQPMTPPALERVVTQCLAKEPDDRWQSAGDLKRALQWTVDGGSQVGIPIAVSARRKDREQLLWGAIAVFVAAFNHPQYSLFHPLISCGESCAVCCVVASRLNRPLLPTPVTGRQHDCIYCQRHGQSVGHLPPAT